MAKTVLSFVVSRQQLSAMRHAHSIFESFGRVPGREPASFKVRGMELKYGGLKFEIEVESGDEAQEEPIYSETIGGSEPSN